MTYVYHCSHCYKTVEVKKEMKDALKREYCECGKEMGKVYKLSSIKTGDGVKQ